MNTSKIILCTVLACIYACVAQAQYKYTLGFDYQRGEYNFNNDIYSYTDAMGAMPAGFGRQLPKEYLENPWQYSDRLSYYYPSSAENLRLRLEVEKPNGYYNKYALDYNNRYRSQFYRINDNYFAEGKLINYQINQNEHEMMATIGKGKRITMPNLKRLHFKVGVDLGIGGMWGANEIYESSSFLKEYEADTIRNGNSISIRYIKYVTDSKGGFVKMKPHVSFMLSVPLSIELDVTKRIGVSATLTQSYLSVIHFDGLGGLREFPPYINFIKKSRPDQLMFGFGLHYKFNDKKKSGVFLSK